MGILLVALIGVAIIAAVVVASTLLQLVMN